MKIFGERLKSLRMEKGLTLEGLGKIMQVSRGAIYGWEKDLQEPSLETVAALAKFFDVSTDYILGLEK